MKLSSKLVLGVCLLAVPVFFQGCSKIIQFDLTYNTSDMNFDIDPIADTTAQASVGSGMVTENIDSFIKAETKGVLGIKNIKSAKLKSCTVTIQNPDANNNFQNFANCSASFYSNSNATPVQLGSISNNPDTYSDNLQLPINTNIDYAPYLNATIFNYSVSGQLRRPITNTLHCTAKATFTVHVQG